MKSSNDFILPEESLGLNISSLMIGKKFIENFNLNPENKLLENHFKVPIIWMDQVHGKTIKEVKDSNKKLIEACDGVYTRLNSLALAVKTADCLPLILCSNDGLEIAAVHVGWRGLCSGIIEKAIEKFHSESDSLRSWLAPSISYLSYEVGQEVYESFLKNDGGSISSFFSSKVHGKWLLNLRLEAQRRLEKLGVEVISGDYCTFKDSDLFYSYRRNQSEGRMVTLVWREDEK